LRTIRINEERERGERERRERERGEREIERHNGYQLKNGNYWK
jgi:hypothetical protein